MSHLPIAQQVYLAGVICAFASFAVGLAGGQIYVWLGSRGSVAAREARKPLRLVQPHAAR